MKHRKRTPLYLAVLTVGLALIVLPAVAQAATEECPPSREYGAKARSLSQPSKGVFATSLGEVSYLYPELSGETSPTPFGGQGERTWIKLTGPAGSMFSMLHGEIGIEVSGPVAWMHVTTRYAEPGTYKEWVSTEQAGCYTPTRYVGETVVAP